MLGSPQQCIGATPVTVASRVSKSAQLDLVLQVTAEERQSMVMALLKGNADLAGRGYTGQGHFFKCPNGHPYVIGNCGGATEQSRCPECGASIGGTQHQLASGNTQDMTMHSLAGQMGT